ncbi:MAG: metallophosphoesterase family protein [Planctomycetales bacterium]|nr:metallophosphoesterase family protein [Planctomycetales bacterium]
MTKEISGVQFIRFIMGQMRMKLLVLADIHGRIQRIPSLAQKVQDCDVIVLAGDITHFGGRQEAFEALSAFAPLRGKPVLAVHGNCDYPAVRDVLQEQYLSLHGCFRELQGMVFVGAGGSLGHSGATPGEAGESEFSKILERSLAGVVPGSRLVLVTHQPAWGTDLDVQFFVQHTGSRSIRSFIEDHQPLLAVSGHMHEARGVDRLGSTILVNPGPFRNGCYAIIEITQTEVQARLGSL